MPNIAHCLRNCLEKALDFVVMDHFQFCLTEFNYIYLRDHRRNTLRQIKVLLYNSQLDQIVDFRIHYLKYEQQVGMKREL